MSERFEYGRNFCNKLLNASRFVVMNLEGYTPALDRPDELKLEDRWILSRLSVRDGRADGTLDRYQFDAATRTSAILSWNDSATGMSR